jgi:hypothetical protein
MAIKVNGTTVIDDSRNLINIASGAGATSTAGAVGAYAYCRDDSGSATTLGGSVSASSLYYLSNAYNGFYIDTSNTPSGTWRVMGYSSGNNRGTVLLRIS